MSVKVWFYTSIKNDKDEELDLLNYYKTTNNKHCIYSIKAGEICSEFIARYFKRVEIMPDLLLDKVLEENYNEQDYEKSIKYIHNGIYKANIKTMLEDSKTNFELNTFKESKLVREKLVDKYQEINQKLKESVNEPKIEIYALLGI